MEEIADDRPRRSPGPGHVVRLLMPAFAASTVVVLIGVVLAGSHHRTLGVILIVVGAVGGLAVRAWLMLRDQQGRRPQA
jgi:uncharacterized membrane protein